MKTIYVLTVDSSTGFHNMYAPVYDLEGYIFDTDGDEIPEELYIPYECII